MKAPLLISMNGYLTNANEWPVECRPHIQALLTRENPIVFKPTREAAWKYACYSALRKGLLSKPENGRHPIGIPIQNRAIMWFTEHLYDLADVSPRGLVKVAKAFFDNCLMQRSPQSLSGHRQLMLVPLPAQSPQQAPTAPQLFLRPQAPPLPPPTRMVSGLQITF